MSTTGTDAARHGTGDADLTIMLAAHQGLRRDLTRLARAAAPSELLTHLQHEERDALPLIGTGLSAAEWRRVGFRIARKNGLSAGGEMFAWLNDGAAPAEAATVLRTLPPPARLLYRAVWRPRYARTPRW